MSICETHPEVAKQWHPTKNGELEPNQFTRGSQTNIWWICSNMCTFGCEHVWNSKIQTRCITTRKGGCPFCCNKKLCYHKSLEYTHPELSKQWHPTKNGNLKPSDVSAGSSKRVWWLYKYNCKEGCIREWQTKVSHRTALTHNSSICRVSCIHTSIVVSHPEIAKEWHESKNNKKPEEYSYGSEQKVWWRCSNNKAHEWKTMISHRTFNNSGCPKCVNKTEKKLLNYLLPKFPDILTEFTIDTCKNKTFLRFDYFIPSLKIIIELDGEQHFIKVNNRPDPKLAQARDIYKMKCAIEKGYKFIRIFQKDVYNSNDLWLDEYLLPHINNTSLEPVYISKDEAVYNTHKELLNAS